MQATWRPSSALTSRQVYVSPELWSEGQNEAVVGYLAVAMRLEANRGIAPSRQKELSEMHISRKTYVRNLKRA